MKNLIMKLPIILMTMLVMFSMSACDEPEDVNPSDEDTTANWDPNDVGEVGNRTAAQMRNYLVYGEFGQASGTGKTTNTTPYGEWGALDGVYEGSKKMKFIQNGPWINTSGADEGRWVITSESENFRVRFPESTVLY